MPQGHNNQGSARPGATTSDQPAAFDRDGARDFARAIARSLLDDRCEDVVILDVADQTTVTACIVIASGTSDRQMRASLDHLDEVAQEHGTKVARVSKDENTTWLLADFVDVVVHLFEPNARAFYDLESMWLDAPRIDPPQPSRRAGPAAGGESA